MRNVTITFTSEAFKEATLARIRRELESEAEFAANGGPTFRDIEDVSVSEGFTSVLLKDGTEYLYNNTGVARIKVFNS